MKKLNKGITLVALVVTIVVLLILAGISINMVLGENGLIAKANEAKYRTEQITKGEEVFLKDYEDIINGTYIEVEQVVDEFPGILEGNGTEDFPYTINSIEDLVYFANQVKKGNSFENEYVELGVSLSFYEDKSYVNPNKNYQFNEEKGIYEENESSDKTIKELLTSIYGWLPIGSTKEVSDESFKGVFEGNGLAIKNLYMRQNIQEYSFWGLFANNMGTIQNLKIINANIEMTGKENTYSFVGGICGDNQGIIKNCETSGEIYFDGNYGLAAGTTGRNVGKIQKCQNRINISGKMRFIGGIAPQNLGEISESSNIGNIKTETGIYIGGIAGILDNGGMITSCYNSGNIKIHNDNAYNIGGIVGQNNVGSVSACYNKGTITTVETQAETTAAIGGISGLSCANISNCYNVGEINLVNIDNGNNEYKVGGITGTQWKHILVNCYNEGKISGYENSVKGGIVGYIDKASEGTISNNHYFDNIENGIGNLEIENEKYTIKEKNKIDKMELLNILNTDCDMWKEDANNLNDSFPILKWQIKN